MDNFDLRKYLAEGRLLKEAIDYSSIKGEMKKIYDIDVDLDTIKDFVTSYNDSEGMDVFDTTEREDFYLYLKDEGKLLKENEEQGYTLYDTKVEYDNGKTGYMFQLVNSEDREENEIGFDQLFFDDEDNSLEMGVDFNSFDQGSYQEGEYTADEAMELYRKISEGIIKENITKLDNYALEIYSDFRKDPSIHFPDVEFEVDEEGFALENDSNYSQLKKYKREIMGLHALFGEESGVKDKNGLQLSMDGVIDNI